MYLLHLLEFLFTQHVKLQETYFLYKYMIKFLKSNLVIRLQQHTKELTNKLMQYEDIISSKNRITRERDSIKHKFNRIETIT